MKTINKVLKTTFVAIMAISVLSQSSTKNVNALSKEISLDFQEIINVSNDSLHSKVIEEVKKQSEDVIQSEKIASYSVTTVKNGTKMYNYVKAENVSNIEASTTYKLVQQAGKYSGRKLSKSAGAITGPNGKETYYNLDMSRVVKNMQRKGYKEKYWVRSDGVKMFGNYIIVAAAHSIRPVGSIYQTSLGLGIVCDTGGFAASNPKLTDIAVTW